MQYYSEEWNPKDVPDFIIRSLTEKEFAFDHNGSGYNDRYNAFATLRELEARVKTLNPYAICASTAYYSAPEKREGWLKAELVFDIDAKDQPVRSCACEPGTICEVCISEAKELALAIMDTLRQDFGLREVYLAYSGRGYHVHVPDDRAEHIESRGHILEYVMGAVMPKDMQMVGGYAGTWRKMMGLTISKLQERDLPFLAPVVAKKIINARPQILQQLAARKQTFLDVPGVGKASGEKLLPKLMEYSSLTVDGKVTIDTKRILRLPTSLHSKISMICTLVKNPETFDPFSTAVPAFVYERE
jgi:DNA primase small subunit